MTFWILMVLAVCLSYISLKWHNILFSLGGTLSWLALWRYNLNYPPTNVTQGSIVHEWMGYAFIIMAIAVIYIWFRNRGRSESVTRIGASEDKDEIIARTTRMESRTGKPLMEMSSEEYRAYISRKTHPKVRRR